MGVVCRGTCTCEDWDDVGHESSDAASDTWVTVGAVRYRLAVMKDSVIYSP